MSKSIQFKDKNNEKIYPLAFVPIGYVILTVINENPSKYYEGVFELTAKGCALVGVDFDDNDFKEPEKIIGEKEHELTIDEMPWHEHTSSNGETGAILNWDNNASGMYWGYSAYSSSYASSGAQALDRLKTGRTGGGKKHNNIQPSFPLFIWKRVA